MMLKNQALIENNCLYHCNAQHEVLALMFVFLLLIG